MSRNLFKLSDMSLMERSMSNSKYTTLSEKESLSGIDNKSTLKLCFLKVVSNEIENSNTTNIMNISGNTASLVKVNNTTNVKEISNTENMSGKMSKLCSLSLIEDETSDSRSPVDSKKKCILLNKKENSLGIDDKTTSKLCILKVAPTKVEKSKSINDVNASETATSLVNIGSATANTSCQIISVNSLAPLIKNNVASATSNINGIHFTPIQPKPPGFQAPDPMTKPKLPSTRKKKCLIPEPAIYRCDICEKKFTRPFAVTRHKLHIHGIQCDNNSVSPSPVKVKQPGEYPCRVCAKSFTKTPNRRRHERTFHKINPVSFKRSYKCSECLSVFSGKTLITNHMADAHPNINIKPELMTFNSPEEFRKWKERIEKSTTSEYIVTHRATNEKFVVLKYSCHRSGSFESRSCGKRNLKLRGSVKTGFFCPAYIRAKTFTDDNRVEVLFIPLHLGHEFEVERLRFGNRIKSNENAKLHQCRICKKIFSESNNRRQHEINVHGLTEKYELNLKCPICFDVFPDRKRIVFHISKFHSEVKLEVLHMNFKTLKEFEEWKLDIENRTASEYTLELSYQKKDCNFQRFDCYLSGVSKIGVLCPSSMLVKECLMNDKGVNVKYLTTHIHHDDWQPEQSQQNDTVVNKHTDINDIHEEAEKIVTSVNSIQNDENSWTIFPFLNEINTYEVKRLNIECSDDACEVRCVSCNICQHKFTCSCSDSLLECGICIHIHIVCLKYCQVVEEDIEDYSCFEVDLSYDVRDYADVMENGIDDLKNNVLQGIRENLQVVKLRDQAITALSSLLVDIKECRNAKNLQYLVKSLSILKKKMNSSENSPASSSKILCKNNSSPLSTEIRLNQNQNNILERVIQFTIQSNNSN